MLTNKQKFNRKHKQPLNKSNSLKEISKLSGYTLPSIKKVFRLGIGAFKTNRSAVRPNVKSAEQWAYARVYASVNPSTKAYKVDKVHLKKKKKR